MSKNNNKKNSNANNKNRKNDISKVEETEVKNEKVAEEVIEELSDEEQVKKQVKANSEQVKANAEQVKENKSRIRVVYILMGIMGVAVIALIVAVSVLIAKVHKNDDEIEKIYGKTVLGDALADDDDLEDIQEVEVVTPIEESTPSVKESEMPVVNSEEEVVEPEEPALRDVVAPILSKDSYFNHFAINGYKFNVPSKYTCSYRDGSGVIISMPDIFQMTVTAKGRSFDALLNDTSVLTDKAKDIGGENVSDVDVCTVNGRRYAYFRFTYKEELNFVVYGETPDGKSHTGGQIHFTKEDMTDDELLIIYDSVASTIESTEDKDTDADEISKQNSSINVPFTDVNTIVYGNLSVTYAVPSNLWYSGSFTYDAYSTDMYCNEDTWASVKLENHDNYKSAVKMIIANSTSVSENEIAMPEMVTIGEYTVYYTIDSKKASSGGMDQHILAACDIDGKRIYSVDYSIYGSNEEITVDTIEEFFEIEK